MLKKKCRQYKEVEIKAGRWERSREEK